MMIQTTDRCVSVFDGVGCNLDDGHDNNHVGIIDGFPIRWTDTENQETCDVCPDSGRYNAFDQCLECGTPSPGLRNVYHQRDGTVIA